MAPAHLRLPRTIPAIKNVRVFTSTKLLIHRSKITSKAQSARTTSASCEAVISRRALQLSLAAALPFGLLVEDATALPLAPLGSVRTGGEKLTRLSIEEVKDILARDLSEGQYFVTGNLTQAIFEDDCRFADPTNDIKGLSRYVKALGILFDPDWSKVVLQDIKLTGPDTIEADWLLGGYLRTQFFPWNPKVEPFKGHTVYTLSPQGLIQSQVQTWSISGQQALLETFTPTSGPRQQLL